VALRALHRSIGLVCGGNYKGKGKDSDNNTTLMMDGEAERYMKSIYFDAKHPAGFSKVNKLYHAVKDRYNIGRRDVVNFLLQQDTYTGHVVKKKPKHFYGITIPRPNFMLELDTAHFNFGTKFKYFIVGIDSFSRRIAARAVPDIKMIHSRPAISEIIAELGGTESIRVDQGVEFRSHEVLNMLKRRGIKSYFSYAPYKSAIVERSIRTLKAKLYAVMQHKGSKQWQRYLPDIIKSYNATLHSSIGMAPKDVQPEHVAELWFKAKHTRFVNEPLPKNYKFAINDAVKINQIRENFAKEFYENNSPRIYFVSYRMSPAGVHRYKLKTEHNKPLRGTYTNNQLQAVKITDNTRYRIERVISRKKVGRTLMGLVKWWGYPTEFNSYVAMSEIKKLR